MHKDLCEIKMCFFMFLVNFGVRAKQRGRKGGDRHTVLAGAGSVII